MKDIVISAKFVRREAVVFLLCFGLSFLINLFAVVRFDRPWIELLSQIGYVVVIGIGIYLLLWIPRLIVAVAKRLFGRKK